MSRNLNNNSPGSERPDSPRFDDNTVVSEDKLFAYRGAVKDLNDATR